MPLPMPFNPVSHVENRRLVEAAYGTGKLEAWERSHIHECQICQSVFYVLVVQVMGLDGSIAKEA